MPVLAMGGEESVGENAANAMKRVADDVQTVVLPAPATGSPSRLPRVLAALTLFLAPYRDAARDKQHTGA